MTTNDVLIRHNFVTKIQLKSDEGVLSKDLKVKIMAMRIEYGKIRKSFDEDVQEFVKSITPEDFNKLQSKTDRTEEENKILQEMVEKVNSEYSSYIQTRGTNEVNVNYKYFTPEQYNEIVEVNSGNDVEINGQKLNAADFLEILYNLFVED